MPNNPDDDLSTYYLPTDDGRPARPGHRLDALVREIAEQGVLFGKDVPWATKGEPGTAAEALPAVRAFVERAVSTERPNDSQQPAAATHREPVRFFDGTWSDPRMAVEATDADLAVAILQGARRARADIEAIELAAAQLAREHGVTVRRLAQAAGISERAANDRYRRKPHP
jgi:hypothetical protein